MNDARDARRRGRVRSGAAECALFISEGDVAHHDLGGGQLAHQAEREVERRRHILDERDGGVGLEQHLCARGLASEDELVSRLDVVGAVLALPLGKVRVRGPAAVPDVLVGRRATRPANNVRDRGELLAHGRLARVAAAPVDGKIGAEDVCEQEKLRRW
jgi:hypothetical protein